MANRRKKPTEQLIGIPQLGPEQAIPLLRTQVDKASQLLASRPLGSDAYSSWELVTINILEKAFGDNSPNVSNVQSVGKYGAFPAFAGEDWWEQHRSQSLQTQKTRVQALIDLLETEAQLQSSGQISPQSHLHGSKIFLVHGHDERVLHETARFLEHLKQVVVVLREQPNQGRTIIEKFENYAEVGFSVVLLTGDDRGAANAIKYEEQRLRARQNVILELGYFLGKLGRSRVCALYTAGVEIPSDYSGVLFIEFDAAGGWRLQLAKELKAAGLPVDMNLAL